MKNNDYGEKLKDPRWQRKRLEIMQRDAFTCQYCGDKETTLNVHHFKYSGDPWEAASEDLITVCEDCHNVLEILKGVNGINERDTKIVKHKDDEVDLKMVSFFNSDKSFMEIKHRKSFINAFCINDKFIKKVEEIISIYKANKK